MADPIRNTDVSADLISSTYQNSTPFRMSDYRNRIYWDYEANPSNGNRPYGIRQFPGGEIRFSDFISSIPAYGVDFCIVSGGAGGGSNSAAYSAGGGGGGGTVYMGSINVPEGHPTGSGIGEWNRITVVVGAGGLGGTPTRGGGLGSFSYIALYYITPNTVGDGYQVYIRAGGGAGGRGYVVQNGFTNTTTNPSHSGNGGGGGASYNVLNAGTGSGGGGEHSGGSGAYISNDSTNRFGAYAGGGGGAGGNGNSAQIYPFGQYNPRAGDGGVGFNLSSFGLNFDVGGGGGGGCFDEVNNQRYGYGGGGAGGNGGSNNNNNLYYVAGNGVDNRGGGGGGAGGSGPGAGLAGAGGSGVVYFKYLANKGQRFNGGTVSLVSIGGQNFYLHTFTGSGTFYAYS